MLKDKEYLKPWQQKPKKQYPKWVETMQEDQTLKQLLYSDDDPKANKLVKKTLDMGTSGSKLFKNGAWRIHDKVRSRVLLTKTADNTLILNEGQEEDHAERLADIYHKFVDTFEKVHG